MAGKSGNDPGTDGSSSGLALEIEVGFDSESATYYVVSSEIPGLHIEAPTFEDFVEVARDVASDLVEAPGRRMQFTFRRTVELVSSDGR